jgi:hypothetical protein
VNRLDSATQLLFDGLDAAEPARRFPEALVSSPIFLTNGFLEPKDGLEREEPDRPALPVGAHGERKMPEEPLCARPYQVA